MVDCPLILTAAGALDEERGSRPTRRHNGDQATPSEYKSPDAPGPGDAYKVGYARNCELFGPVRRVVLLFPL
jgi:hypothetical protein